MLGTYMFKCKLLRHNVLSIRLNETCGNVLYCQYNQGDLIIRSGCSYYSVYKEPFCLISDYMKKFVRKHPTKKRLRLPSEYCRVIFHLRSLIYRKYCFVNCHHHHDYVFHKLLDRLKISYEFLEMHQFYQTLVHKEILEPRIKCEIYQDQEDKLSKEARPIYRVFRNHRRYKEIKDLPLTEQHVNVGK